MDEPAMLETAKRRYRDEMYESVTAIRIVRSVYEAVVEVEMRARQVVLHRVAVQRISRYAECGVIFYRISQFRLHLPFSFRSSPRQTPCKCD
jgi:hypothetical protein